jgi:hypothetical protein
VLIKVIRRGRMDVDGLGAVCGQRKFHWVYRERLVSMRLLEKGQNIATVAQGYLWIQA